MDSQLEREAVIVEPILSFCASLHQNGLMSSSDIAGIFILTYLGLRRPKSWSNGRLKTRVSLSFDASHVSSTPSSALICVIPGLLDILDRDYVAKRIGEGWETTTVLYVFDSLQLRGIKKNANDYVNRCLVSWAFGLRPCCLMFRIPSPLEVLLQQAEGTRVITLFLTRKQLETKHIAMLYYMEGMQNHAKDSLEFLLHDMKHMENFVDPSIYQEQVGFFKCMLKLSSELNPPKKSTTRTHGSEGVSPISCHQKGCETTLGNCSSNTISESFIPSDEVQSSLSTCHGLNQITTNEVQSSLSTCHGLNQRPSSTCCDAEGNLILNRVAPPAVAPKCVSPKIFFIDICSYDKQLWRELEYSISDMNCYSTHLLQYVLAKMLFATERLLKNSQPIPSGDLPSTHESSDISLKRNDVLPKDRTSVRYNIDADHDAKTSIEEGSRNNSAGIAENMSVSPSEQLKECLLERWLLVLLRFGMLPDRTMESVHPVVENEDRHEHEQQECSLNSLHLGPQTRRVDESVVDNYTSTCSEAHAAAVGMVRTAFKERGPLTAAEGAALRGFFQAQACSSG